MFSLLFCLYVSCFLFWVLSVSYCFWCLAVSVDLATTSIVLPLMMKVNVKWNNLFFYWLLVCLHALIHFLPTWRLFIENKTKFVIIIFRVMFLFWVLSVFFLVFFGALLYLYVLLLLPSGVFALMIIYWYYTLNQNAVFWLVDERGIFFLPILSFFRFSTIAGVFA